MTPELTITLIVISVLVSIFLLLFYPLNIFFYRKYFNYRYYYKISRLVQKKDYRLINNYYFKIDGVSQAHFDHLLFGDKYIYAISDKYWEKGIIGKPQDESWVLGKNYKKRTFIDNPLKKNELRIEKLSLISGISRDMFVTIILVNNNCLVDEKVTLNDKNIIVKEKNFVRAIEKFENSPIAKINEEQLQKAIYLLNDLKF